MKNGTSKCVVDSAEIRDQEKKESHSNIAKFDVSRTRQGSKTVHISETGMGSVELYKTNFKSHLMMFIYGLVKNMKQKDAANALGITQAQVSLLKNQRVSQFSIDRLIEMAFAGGFTFKLSPHQIAKGNSTDNSSNQLDVL